MSEFGLYISPACAAVAFFSSLCARLQRAGGNAPAHLWREADEERNEINHLTGQSSEKEEGGGDVAEDEEEERGARGVCYCKV